MTTDGETAAGRGNGLSGVLPTLVAAAFFVWFATHLPPVMAGGTVLYSLAWVPSLSINLSFLVDGLSLTFALLISGIGTLVMLYSNVYLRGHRLYARFALFITSFMLSMLGLVLADNLIALFVFWELTTLTSYMLIGFAHTTEKGRWSALQALFVTGAGGLAFLAGLILLGLTAGTFEISEINAQGDALKAHALYVPILILILIGAFTKSAQVPFHFWLPNAMAAPTPVSAFLHSATMVKGGVYVMARLHPGLSGTDLWFYTLTLFGGATAVWASLLALRQTDLKQVLAYTTLMALGTLTLLLGQSSDYAMTAFATFLVVHSLYKASLFLMVGCVDHATGTREAGTLGGLARAMPVTAVAAALAALSMAGLPPFFGFIGKELQYAAGAGAERMGLFILAASLAANAMMFSAAWIVAFGPFWRKPGGALPRTPHEAPAAMWIGPLLLAGLGLAFGLMPGLAQVAVVDPTVAAVGGGAAAPKELKLWAGVNLPLFLSLATTALGLTLYLAHRPVRALLARADAATVSMDRLWDRFLDGLKAFAAWQTRLIQTGYLRQYLFRTFMTVFLALGGTIAVRNIGISLPGLDDLTLRQAAIIALLLGGTALATVTSSRIAAIAALGVVGISVALIFILFGAPDVAITQLMVETLVVVLVAVALLRLPYLGRPGERDWRPADAALAVAIGGAVTVTLLAVLATPLDRRLTDFFEAASWPEAFGRNIVNVILVDFRALDTFGEIAVVVIAALSSYALLRTTGKGASK